MSKNNLDQKSMLFGAAPMEKEKKKPAPSSLTTTSKASTTPKKTHTHLSPAACEKKIAEGKELHERALKHLKTSLFQWSPDHVAAASTLEAAGNCYNAAGELEKAQELYILSADSHDKAGSAAACAQTLLKASKVAKIRDDSPAAAELFQRISTMWGVNGDPNRAGEFLLKAAKELEKGDPSKAQELYLRGLDHLCPEDTPESEMGTCTAIVPEAFRQCFDFYMTVRSSAPNVVAGSFTIPTLEIVNFCHRMIRIFSGLEAEASKCRLIVTITLLQLEMGDVVAADRGFMDKLSDSEYLKSNESALAEEFLAAYKELDCDKLESAQRSHHLVHLDRSVQVMARSLSLLRGHNGGNDTPSSVSSSSTPSISQTVVKTVEPTPRASVVPQQEKQEQEKDDMSDEKVAASLDALVIEQDIEKEVVVADEDANNEKAEEEEEEDDDFDLT